MTKTEELLALADELTVIGNHQPGAMYTNTGYAWHPANTCLPAAAALREYAATMDAEPVEETDDEFAAQIAKMDAKPAPAREPLTDDEVGQIAMQIYGMRDWTRMDIRFARAVLAAQGIGVKNDSNTISTRA
jgi:hypothetical protein